MQNLKPLIERLENNQVSAHEVNVFLARQISREEVLTSKPKAQMIARIQCLMVEAGLITDQEFVDQLQA